MIGNLGALLLGVLLFALLIRASYWWFVQDMAEHWYRQREISWEESTGKPWYVLRYDRWQARVRARRARQ
jgi:Zn-dependent protease with chaperone function